MIFRPLKAGLKKAVVITILITAGTLCAILCEIVSAATINIPQDFGTIQAGIDAAADGDLILIAPGTYNENLYINQPGLTLASWYYTTGQHAYVGQTVIDGGGRKTITVGPDADQTEINGLRIKDGDDGINVRSNIYILNNHIVSNKDGIDYEGGGGICHNNFFACNRDDGIDLDGPTAVEITSNTIRDNDDDGIEIRLHSYAGPTLNIVITANLIIDNGEDGIQLVDYADVSDRVFRIEHNIFIDNEMAALGCMAGGNTYENYSGAAIPERVYLVNNTFVSNNYGVAGGGNLIALNNIFAYTDHVALRRVGGDSIAAFNLFWANGSNYEGSNIDPVDTLFANPLFDAGYRLKPDSPARNNGTSFFEWQGDVVLDLAGTAYQETAPEIGAREYFDPPESDPLQIGCENPPEVKCGDRKKDECFLSVVVSGSFLEPCLSVLRQFRDRLLSNSRIGRSIIHLYDMLSPELITLIQRHTWAKTGIRLASVSLVVLSYMVIHFKLVYGLFLAITTSLLVSVILYIIRTPEPTRPPFHETA